MPDTLEPALVSVPLKVHDRDQLLLDMHAKIARIETKTDFLIAASSDHEQRIRSNEKWRWGIPGSFMAALLALFTGGTLPHT